MAIAIRGTTPTTTIQSGTNPISVTLTGTKQPQAGDVLLIIVGNNFYALSNITTPTVGGSTTGVVASVTADAGTNSAHMKSYTYVVGSTGDLTVQETETGTTDEEKSLIVYVLSGVDISTPIDDAQSATGASSSTQTAPAVSPTTTDAFLICEVNTGASGGNTYTPPSGMTEDCDLSLVGLYQASSASLQLSASGSTGTKSFTANASNPYAAGSWAMRTASAAAPADPGPFEMLAAPGFNSPNGMFQSIATIEPPTAVSSTAELTNHAVVTGDVTATVTVNDTNPTNTHTTSGVTSTQTTTDGTAPANAHTTGDPTPSIGTNAVDAANSHTTYDATVSTAVILNVNAELTNHTVVAGDPSDSIAITAELTNHAQITGDATAGLGVPAGAGATSHTTGDALAGVGATDGTNPQHTVATGAPAPSIAVNAIDAANTHTTYDATVSTAVILNVNAPAADNQHITAAPTVEIDAPGGAPSTTHQTLDPAGSIAIADATAPANTHTTSAATAGVGPQPQNALHDFVTSDVVATMGAPIGAPSIAHSAFDATVSTALAPPAFVSVEAGSTWASADNGKTIMSASEGRTSVSGLVG